MVIDARFADLDRLRLPQNYINGSAKKVLHTIPVRKPDKYTWFRVNREPELSFMAPVLEDPEDMRRPTYLVEPKFRNEFRLELVSKILLLGITRKGAPFFWPIRMPDDEGNLDSWNETAMDAAEKAKEKWIRIVPDPALRGYEVFTPQVPIEEPEWPEMELQEMISIAFKNHLIESEDHPLIKKLRGR